MESHQMADMDKAVDGLNSYLGEIDELLTESFTEADTRVKFIDPLLRSVLGWEETQIRRETRFRDEENNHCIDYVLSQTTPILVVEAKKNRKQFEIPAGSKNHIYKLSGSIKQWKNAWSAVTQARAYCDDIGARYALVTNGTQFIAFKALSEHGPWHEGRALVLGSPEKLEKHFSIFYECISRELIAQDRLSEVSSPVEAGESFKQKPRSGQMHATGGFRNQLYGALHGLFGNVLLDVPQDDPEFLKRCYCASSDVTKHGSQLNSFLRDPAPAHKTPIKPVRPGHRKDPFAACLTGNDRQSTVPLVVVMGGAGVGKTTFVRWFFSHHLPKTTQDAAFLVYCDYRTIECEPDELKRVTLQTITDKLLQATRSYTGSYEQLKEIFKTPIADQFAGALKPFADDDVLREQKTSDVITSLSLHDETHLEYLVSYLQNHCKKRVIIVLDNMDQKRRSLQEKLYQTGQLLVHRIGATVLVVMRESTSQVLNKKPEFNAFTTIDFHIRAQPLDAILAKRFDYMADLLSSETVEFVSSTGDKLRIEDIRKFLDLLRRSLIPDSGPAETGHCIQAVSNNNIRRQLELVYAFLVSGQTKIDDYFWSYTQNKTRRIPFHEFLHSLILEDRRVFDEAAGKHFMNVFEPCGSRSASHFTALRILSLFRLHFKQGGELRPQDHVPFENLACEFVDQGLTASDLEFHFRRLSDFGLLVPDGGEIEGEIAQQRFALTQSGAYYFDTLYKQFSYFSIMLQDTSMFDQKTHATCAGLLSRHVSAPKIPIHARRNMSEHFVDYLELREKQELAGVCGQHGVFSKQCFSGAMRDSLDVVRKSTRREQ